MESWLVLQSAHRAGVMEGLDRILQRFADLRVLVIGDAMLDSYLSGTARRLTPEAPAPVVDVSDRRYAPGGAANVAANCSALTAQTQIVSVVGDDRSGRRLTQLLESRR